ncbi:MAG: signal peptide peptidase SppA [Pseudomonadales bacterium]|nr:signal peptide peptidase SppA [Pseudomonadales bacterium]
MSEPGRMKRIFRKIGSIFDTLRAFVSNLFFLILIILLFSVIFSGEESVKVPVGGALVLNLQGDIVEELTQKDPFAAIMASDSRVAETRLRDIISALDKVKEDERISTVVLNLGELGYSSTAHTARIGTALAQLQEAGKRLVSAGNFYSQEQYYLASFADAVYMHPHGQLLLEGMGTYQIYFRNLLDKLKVNMHIFRVGTYKAAVEPFIRSDMSVAAKEANSALLGTLWQQYVETVADNRNLEVKDIRSYADNYSELLTRTQGDMARVALEQGFVDELLSADEIRNRLIDEVGERENDFRQIDFKSYIAERHKAAKSSPDKIGIIVARGEIQMGDQPRGTIGADSLVELIKNARHDPDIKAVVLRVDSPGGSAFASELIRQELELTQQYGKPVVVSMAGVAASGGYWISATANEIWAAPGTITGSIGVFGIFPTFENSLDSIGIYMDGVGTSALSGAGNPLTEIQPEFENILQANVENTYQRFINLVSRGRNMQPDAVDKIAQGRIWTGVDALELGLVDKLGNVEEAVASAAELAQITEYEIQYLEKVLTPKEKLINEIAENLAVYSPRPNTAVSQDNSVGMKILNPLLRAIGILNKLDDPIHTYALCEMCTVH